jgi:hypothetical protein
MKVRRIGEGVGIDLFSGEQIVALSQRGRFTHSAGFGFGTFGLVRYGETQKIGGIYQRRRSGYNNFTGPPPANAPTYFVKMRSYGPTNPKTPIQMANRQKMTNATTAWQGLTDEEKSVYNKRASRKGRVGYFLFMSEHMKSH